MTAVPRSFSLLLLHLLVAAETVWTCVGWSLPTPSSRRDFVNNLFRSSSSSALIISNIAPFASAASDSSKAVDELPEFLRPYTELAPLGRPRITEKTKGLTLEQLARRLEHDLVLGTEERGGYFVTGDISTDIFDDFCVFTDPTNQVSSLSQYQRALKILFDPESSNVELLDPIQVDPAARTLTAKIRSRGYLQLPWKPYISTYDSIISYSVDPDGLVTRQDQVWSKSATEALLETFTPSLNSPPPKCNLARPPDEPTEVTRLFALVNGRRPTDYTQDERFEIAHLIENICSNPWDWNANELPGKWMLVYLQLGPTGAGIDRRIPFPEFDFNDNFQIFSTTNITNIGQVLGRLADVRVSGSLREHEALQTKSPKRYEVDIDRGSLCVMGDNCVPLPISGQGLFDGLYLGSRLRIGQNINGGGARVVQVRVA
jgi:hypothetical protein